MLHDQLLDLPARVSRNSTDQRAEGGGENDNDDAGGEGDARTIEETGEDVAAERVGAEPMTGRWRSQALGDVNEIRRVPG